MLSLISLVLLGTSAFASASSVSAVRPTGVQWKSLSSRHHAKPAIKKTNRFFNFLNIFSSGNQFETANTVTAATVSESSLWSDIAPLFPLVTALPSAEEAQVDFETIRNLRFMDDPEVENFKRRSSWMYPDDGCFARAALATRNFQDYAKSNLGRDQQLWKVFIFGDLKVNTNHSPEGSVGWWYHVAPVARVGNEVLVFDPAIQYSAPMPLKDWVLTMVPSVGDAYLDLCNANSSLPGDVCDRSEFAQDLDVSQAEVEQPYFLMAERYRVQELGMNADEVLGDYPEWSPKVNP